MTRRTRLGWGVTVAGCCGWLLANGALAQDSDHATLDFDLGAQHSDNVSRVKVDEQSDTIGTARVALSFEQDRPRIDTSIDGNLEYNRYFDDSYDDDVVGGVNAALIAALVPERFDWAFEDNYGQIAQNRLAVDTPDNRQSFNYFSTGPDLTLPLGSRFSFLLSGRWSDVYYEDSDEGSENLSGSVALSRLLSERTTLSLNGTVTDIEYDASDLFTDYRVTEAFLRLDASGAQTSLAVDLGYTEAERDGETSGGELIRLNISHRITSRSTLSLQAGSEFVDAGQAFRIDQSALGVDLQTSDTVAAADVFRSTYAYLSLDTRRERTGLSAAIFGRRERYENVTTSDRDVIGAQFGWLRSLTPRVTLDLRAGYNDEEFVTSDFAFDEWYAGFGFSWRLTPAVSIRLDGDHYVGSGDGETRDFEENRAFLGIRYSLGRREG
jgi:hypothetical protein